MWATLGKWLAQFLLLPLIKELIESFMTSRKEKQEREQRHKEIDEDIKKIEEAVTPEEQENALSDFVRRARERRRL